MENNTMASIKTSILATDESVWAGTYLLASGDHLRCHDCMQFDDRDWDEADKIVGSVYFEFDHVEEDGTVIEDWDGGEFGYCEGDPFSDFLKYLEEGFGEVVTEKISDED